MTRLVNSLTADAFVVKAFAVHIREIVDIATIEDHWRFERFGNFIKIGLAEDWPFGDDQQRISLLQSAVLVISKFESSLAGKPLPHIVHGFRIIDRNRRPSFE